VNTPISVRNEVCLSGTLYARFWQPQSAVLGGAHSPRLLALSLCNDGSSTGSAGRAILVRMRRSFPGIYSACGAAIRRWHGFVCVRGDDSAMARLCLRAGRRLCDGTALSACGATTRRWHGFVCGRGDDPPRARLCQACDRCVAPDEPCGSCHKPRSGVGDESFQWLDSACHSRLACCVCPMWRSWWSWGHVSPPGAEFWWARGYVSPPGAEFWRARGHVSPLVPSSVG